MISSIWYGLFDMRHHIIWFSHIICDIWYAKMYVIKQFLISFDENAELKVGFTVWNHVTFKFIYQTDWHWFDASNSGCQMNPFNERWLSNSPVTLRFFYLKNQCLICKKGLYYMNYNWLIMIKLSLRVWIDSLPWYSLNCICFHLPLINKEAHSQNRYRWKRSFLEFKTF